MSDRIPSLWTTVKHLRLDKRSRGAASLMDVVHDRIQKFNQDLLKLLELHEIASYPPAHRATLDLLSICGAVLRRSEELRGWCTTAQPAFEMYISTYAPCDTMDKTQLRRSPFQFLQDMKDVLQLAECRLSVPLGLNVISALCVSARQTLAVHASLYNNNEFDFSSVRSFDTNTLVSDVFDPIDIEDRTTCEFVAETKGSGAGEAKVRQGDGEILLIQKHGLPAIAVCRILPTGVRMLLYPCFRGNENIEVMVTEDDNCTLMMNGSHSTLRLLADEKTIRKWATILRSVFASIEIGSDPKAVDSLGIAQPSDTAAEKQRLLPVPACQSSGVVSSFIKLKRISIGLPSGFASDLSGFLNDMQALEENPQKEEAVDNEKSPYEDEGLTDETQFSEYTIVPIRESRLQLPVEPLSLPAVPNVKPPAPPTSAPLNVEATTVPIASDKPTLNSNLIEANITVMSMPNPASDSDTDSSISTSSLSSAEDLISAKEPADIEQQPSGKPTREQLWLAEQRRKKIAEQLRGKEILAIRKLLETSSFKADEAPFAPKDSSKKQEAAVTSARPVSSMNPFRRPPSIPPPAVNVPTDKDNNEETEEVLIELEYNLNNVALIGSEPAALEAVSEIDAKSAFSASDRAKNIKEENEGCQSNLPTEQQNAVLFEPLREIENSQEDSRPENAEIAEDHKSILPSVTEETNLSDTQDATISQASGNFDSSSCLEKTYIKNSPHILKSGSFESLPPAPTPQAPPTPESPLQVIPLGSPSHHDKSLSTQNLVLHHNEQPQKLFEAEQPSLEAFVIGFKQPKRRNVPLVRKLMKMFELPKVKRDNDIYVPGDYARLHQQAKREKIEEQPSAPKPLKQPPPVPARRGSVKTSLGSAASNSKEDAQERHANNKIEPLEEHKLPETESSLRVLKGETLDENAAHYAILEADETPQDSQKAESFAVNKNPFVARNSTSTSLTQQSSKSGKRATSVPAALVPMGLQATQLSESMSTMTSDAAAPDHCVRDVGAEHFTKVSKVERPLTALYKSGSVSTISSSDLPSSHLTPKGQATAIYRQSNNRTVEVGMSPFSPASQARSLSSNESTRILTKDRSFSSLSLVTPQSSASLASGSSTTSSLSNVSDLSIITRSRKDWTRYTREMSDTGRFKKEGLTLMPPLQLNSHVPTPPEPSSLSSNLMDVEELPTLDPRVLEERAKAAAEREVKSKLDAQAKIRAEGQARLQMQAKERYDAFVPKSSISSRLPPVEEEKFFTQNRADYSANLWVSRWIVNRWVPLSQLELRTELKLLHHSCTIHIQQLQQPLWFDAESQVRRSSTHDVEVRIRDDIYMFRSRNANNAQKLIMILSSVKSGASRKLRMEFGSREFKSYVSTIPRKELKA